MGMDGLHQGVNTTYELFYFCSIIRSISWRSDSGIAEVLKTLEMHFWDLSQWDEMCFEYHRVIFHWQKWVKNFSVVLQPNSKSHPSAAWCLLYKRMELEMTCTVDTFVNHHLFNWGLWQHMKQVVLNISIKLAWL